MKKKFEKYEEVAQYLLDQFAKEFSLDHVEGKQEVSGQRSGATWEIDAKGVRIGHDGFVIVECKRYTTSKLKQEHMAEIAYRIIDAGAKGGIAVSPLGLQEGAKKVAAAERIIEVKLNPDCTKYEYVLSFLNKVMVGISDEVRVTDSVSAKIIHEDGTEEDIKLA